MVRINSVKKNAAILVGAAALGAVSGANAAAIPAGQGQGNAAILDIEATVLRLPVSVAARHRNPVLCTGDIQRQWLTAGRTATAHLCATGARQCQARVEGTEGQARSVAERPRH